jgi:hypothetical protein
MKRRYPFSLTDQEAIALGEAVFTDVPALLLAREHAWNGCKFTDPQEYNFILASDYEEVRIIERALSEVAGSGNWII